MARFSERDCSAIYAIADTWKRTCMVEAKSLLWHGEDVWSQQNLQAFKRCFIDRPDESKESFEDKFKRQLSTEGPEVTKVACELVLIYFLFPSSVSGTRKRELIKAIASWKELVIPTDDAEVLSHLDVGIGGPGLAYNTRRPFEIAFLAQLALELGAKQAAEREGVLSDHLKLRALLDDLEREGDFTRQGRDILLHLLFPDHYERIASRNHKQLIAHTFSEILDTGSAPEDLDDRLLAIRTKLEQLVSNENLDFYLSPLRECWYVSGQAQEIEPLQGLGIKRQIVFYGPPGTGKTYEARAVADRFARQGILRAWGPKRYFGDVAAVDSLLKQRVRRVQLHPGYSYEDLVRGLQLVDGGKTEYRDGVLLQIIAGLQQDPTELRAVPFVLILDEMNRADLSKVLGECFSLLEDRDIPVQLGGQDKRPREVCIPPNLYFVGTMNLIDQSLEQIDFALRRRFLWFFRGFDREQFIEVSKYRWEELRKQKRIRKSWDRFEAEFEVLADRAEAINSEIERHPSLGDQYQIGHTYFCDVVHFIEKDLAVTPGRRYSLFGRKGQGLEQTIGTL